MSQRFRHRGDAGLTILEAVMALAVSAVAVAGIATGYTMAITSAERSAHSFAADALAVQRLEQTRASQWDPDSAMPDQLVASNFPAQIAVLDLPRSGSNMVYATNFTTIFTVSTDPPIRGVRVDCVWRFMDRALVTNTVLSYRRAD